MLSIYEQEYRPQFSGHETFPLRYGWLKKAFDAVQDRGEELGRTIFTQSNAIADFGVGKNMVASIRHWATVVGIIAESEYEEGLTTTPFGNLIFSERGLDPYLENQNTLWLIHWKLAGNPRKTTWHWAFNYFPNRTFSRSVLVQYLSKFSDERGWAKASTATLKRDVECFVRTYVPKRVSKKFGIEDSVECPLTELGLIKTLDGRDNFQFVIGPKPSLGNGTFLYAVEEYWKGTEVNTLSIEALAQGTGSPGRVFQLDESDVIHRLSRVEDLSGGRYRWSETAGLKQLIRINASDTGAKELEFLKLDFPARKRVAV